MLRGFSRDSRNTVLTISIAESLRLFGIFMLLPVFTTFGFQFTSSGFLVGLSFGAYGLSMAVFQIPFGILSDHLGRKRTLLIGMSFFVVGNIICFFTTDITMLLVGRLISGAGAISSVGTAMVQASVPDEKRNQAMAILGIPVGLSFLLGVVIGPAISVYIGTRYIFLISAVLGLTVIIGISRLKEIRMKLQRSGIGITGKSLILGTTGLIVSMLMMSFFYFLPLYHQDFIPSSNYILMIFYPILAGGIIAVALSGYADRGHSQMLAIFCLIIMTVSVPLVFILSYNIMGFSDIVFTGAVFFTGYSIYEIAFPVMVSRNSSKENYGANFATFNMFQHGGQLIGSVAAGSIIGSVISTHSTLLVAVTFLVLMLFAFFIFIFFGINKSKKIETT